MSGKITRCGKYDNCSNTSRSMESSVPSVMEPITVMVIVFFSCLTPSSGNILILCTYYLFSSEDI